MNADRWTRWRKGTGTARQAGGPQALLGHLPPYAAAAVRSRRRRIVIATGIGGAGLLGISLSTRAGSARSTS